jgi:hypothetical protein
LWLFRRWVRCTLNKFTSSIVPLSPLASPFPNSVWWISLYYIHTYTCNVIWTASPPGTLSYLPPADWSHHRPIVTFHTRVLFSSPAPAPSFIILDLDSTYEWKLWYLAFWAWLKVMISSSICFPINYIILFPYDWIIFQCVCVCVCVTFSLLFFGYLSWFHSLVIVNSAAVNMRVQVSS